MPEQQGESRRDDGTTGEATTHSDPANWEQQRNEFLATLGHELRNALTSVRTAIELLRRLDPRHIAFGRARDILDRQVLEMARLVDDLVDYSRIARGRIALRREPVDLVAVARAVLEQHSRELASRDLTLDVALPAVEVWVNADPARLSQVIESLLINAEHSSGPGGHIALQVRGGTPGEAVLTVSDTHGGLSPEALPELFDPFAAAGGHGSRGFNLGLSLVKSLVELHGGSIAVTSAGIGHGTEFTVRLPAAQPAHAARPVASQAAHPGGRRVLIIEDNEDAAESLRLLLELAGHEVVVAPDGEGGVAAARSQRPDAVFCDLELPGEASGFDVARQLRSDPDLGHMLLVAVSGYSSDEDRKKSQEAGFDLHVAKPFDINAIEELLSEEEPRQPEAQSHGAPAR